MFCSIRQKKANKSQTVRLAKYKPNRVGVPGYFNQALCTVPSAPLWSIVLMIIYNILSEAMQTFHCLEELTGVMLQPREGLRYWPAIFLNLLTSSVLRSSEDGYSVDLVVEIHSNDSEHSLKLSTVTAVLKDRGLLLQRKIEEIGADAMEVLVKGLAVYIVYLIASVMSIVSERDPSNEAASKCPLCFYISLYLFTCKTKVIF